MTRRGARSRRVGGGRLVRAGEWHREASRVGPHLNRFALWTTFVRAPDQPGLFVRVVEPARPTHGLVFVHASTVHSEYYLPLALGLAQQGVSVWLPDLRGHGRSEGVVGHVAHWRDHREDVTTVFAAMREHLRPHTPLFAGGESYGGLMAYLAEPACQPAGLLLLSPAMGLQAQVPTVLRWVLSHGVSRVAPVLRSPGRLPFTGVSADPALAQLVDRDRQAVRRYTVGFLVELLRAQDAAQARPNTPTPILALMSRGDRICDNRVTEAVLADRATLDVLDAPAHSLVADRGDIVTARIGAWMRHTAVHPG